MKAPLMLIGIVVLAAGLVFVGQGFQYMPVIHGQFGKSPFDRDPAGPRREGCTGLRWSRTDLMTSVSISLAGTLRSDPARSAVPWRRAEDR
jgi:hypothetical protein